MGSSQLLRNTFFNQKGRPSTPQSGSRPSRAPGNKAAALRRRTILITTRTSVKRVSRSPLLDSSLEQVNKNGIDRRARRHAGPAVSRAVWIAMHPACSWAYRLPQQTDSHSSGTMPGPSSARAPRTQRASPSPIASRRRGAGRMCCARRRCESARSCGRRTRPGQ